MSTSTRLRILFVAGCWYPDEEHPIHGVFIRRHAEAVARKHDVVVLHPTLRADGPLRPELRWARHGKLRELHVELRGRSSAEGGTAASLLAYYRATRSGLRELARQVGRFDFLHYQVVPSVGVVLAAALNLPTVPFGITEHWSGYMPESGVRLGLLRRVYTSILVRRARFVSTVSNYHRHAMEDCGFNGRYLLIPNVVDTERFRPAERRCPGPFRLSVVASLRPEKRVPMIIRTISRLIADGMDIEFNIVGEGPERRAAEAEVGPPGLLGEKIIFHGQQDEATVAESLRDSDALVLFSAFENSPCVIAEAFACGLPVIAPRIGGIPELLTADRGILIPPGDEEALARAVRRLVDGDFSFSTRSTREYAERTFSPERIGELFDEAYIQPPV